jgi:molybdopterin converting factor small subunit
MATLRLFASIREAAGTGTADIDAPTVGAVIDAASELYGPGFTALLGTCRIWLNGEPADRSDVVGAGDEVAVLPPVSGGA